MNNSILVINLGSTSSDVAVFENGKKIFGKSLAHSIDELGKYKDIDEEVQFRKSLIKQALSENNIDMKNIDAIAARGIGCMGRYSAGAYLINAEMSKDAHKAKHRGMASGTIIGFELSEEFGIPAYVYDVVRTDEIDDIARISGVPVIERSGATHTLNTKAVARLVAEEMGKTYETVTLLMCHLGGGISSSIHKEGRIIDVTSTDEGTFTADRSGRVPCEKLLGVFLSGKYTDNELKVMLRGKAGLIGYLGTNDCIEIEKRIEAGDTEAELVYRAMAYQTAKDIGALAAVVSGKVDAIVLTGGIAYSKLFTQWISDYVSFIADVIVKPGSMELEALNNGVLRVLNETEQAKPYQVGETVL